MFNFLQTSLVEFFCKTIAIINSTIYTFYSLNFHLLTSDLWFWLLWFGQLAYTSRNTVQITYIWISNKQCKHWQYTHVQKKVMFFSRQDQESMGNSDKAFSISVFWYEASNLAYQVMLDYPWHDTRKIYPVNGLGFVSVYDYIMGLHLTYTRTDNQRLPARKLLKLEGKNMRGKQNKPYLAP